MQHAGPKEGEGYWILRSGSALWRKNEYYKLKGMHGYKYLEILKYDDLLQNRIKNKLKSEYFRRLKKVFKSKLNGKNVMLAIIPGQYQLCGMELELSVAPRWNCRM